MKVRLQGTRTAELAVQAEVGKGNSRRKASVLVEDVVGNKQEQLAWGLGQAVDKLAERGSVTQSMTDLRGATK